MMSDKSKEGIYNDTNTNSIDSPLIHKQAETIRNRIQTQSKPLIQKQAETISKRIQKIKLFKLVQCKECEDNLKERTMVRD